MLDGPLIANPDLKSLLYLTKTILTLQTFILFTMYIERCSSFSKLNENIAYTCRDSFILDIYIALFKSSTTQRRSRLQHGYSFGVSRRSAQATVGKGLAQSPYVAARAGVEPTTFRLKVIDLTNAPPRP